MSLLSLQRITKTFQSGDGELHALRGVDFTVAPHQWVAIMGQSGSGKSTLLNILGALDRPTTGRYLFDGEPVESLDDETLAHIRNRKMGFVFQQFHLLQRERALGNVELPMIYARMPRAERLERAKKALIRVGLEDRMDHFPNQLSGGQQQRVSIARAIVHEPLILFADEPTGALDSATAKSVMELFAELHRAGMTIVLVTHDAHVASWAERVVTFKDGQILSDLSRSEHAAQLADPLRVA